ncbi:MAG: hypothetical protein AAGI68_17080 [Planctomycetota bacterium]
MGKSLRRWLSVIVILAAVALICFAALWIYGRLDPPVHKYRIAAHTPLTEADAVAYARRALIDDGKNGAAAQPVPYGHQDRSVDGGADGGRLFARNGTDPDSGYVLWSNGYAVTIKRRHGTVECRVHTMK